MTATITYTNGLTLPLRLINGCPRPVAVIVSRSVVSSAPSGYRFPREVIALAVCG